MQFIDLKKQYERLNSEINQSMMILFDSFEFIMGPQVNELESALAEYLDVKHVITCANGTDALSLALMAFDIKEGDAVFAPTFTFYATAETVSLRGATPVFVDIDKDSYNISCSELRASIKRIIRDGTLLPKAIIAVDLFGLPADFSELRKIADEYGLILLEDGAQGFGGSINGRKACSFGDISITSFFPAKPLGCYGDGGAVFTDNDELSSIIRSLRSHGRGIDKYDNIRVGLNSRLDTLQAAILLVKLKAFKNYELEYRNRIASYYNKALKKIVKVPHIPSGYISSYAQYSILLHDPDERDLVQDRLKERQIPSMIYYKKSMHQQCVYRNNLSANWLYPVAEDVSNRILNIPMHPYLSTQEQEMIIETIISACDSRGGTR